MTRYYGGVRSSAGRPWRRWRSILGRSHYVSIRSLVRLGSGRRYGSIGCDPAEREARGPTEKRPCNYCGFRIPPDGAAVCATAAGRVRTLEPAASVRAAAAPIREILTVCAVCDVEGKRADWPGPSSNVRSGRSKPTNWSHMRHAHGTNAHTLDTCHT